MSNASDEAGPPLFPASAVPRADSPVEQLRSIAGQLRDQRREEDATVVLAVADFVSEDAVTIDAARLMVLLAQRLVMC